jgi:broad specificity phosphatase PhoE
VSTLTLVRHGQARPFEKDSDRLSPLGEEQARAVGEYWRRHGIVFDEVVCGSLTRHRQTLACAGLEAGVEDPGWNEYDAGAILERLAPALARENADFVARRKEFDGAASDKNKYFQKMLEPLMDAWLSGRVSADGVEPFADYRSRVLGALRRIVDAEGSSRNVVVFTSGGPIGLCVQHVLRAPDSAFLEVNWRVRNCSISEFTFSRGRLTLDTLNTMGHLDRALWTWR